MTMIHIVLNMKRREYLTATASGSIAMLAGCGTQGLLGDDGPEALKVHNAGDNRHTVSLTLSQEGSGKTLVDESFKLDPSAEKEFELNASGTFSITTKLESDYSRPYTWTGSSCPDAPLNIIINGSEAIDYQASACD